MPQKTPSSTNLALIVPEVMPRQEPPILNLGTPPKWLKSESQKRLIKVLHYDAARQQGANVFALSTILCGLELIALKKEAGHGHWGDVLDKYLIPTGITERHVRRYIEVAEGATRKMARAGKIAPLLIGKPMEADEFQKLQDAINETTDAKTWRGLMEDCGYGKKKAKGGWHPNEEAVARFAEHVGYDDDYERWTETQKAEFKAWQKDEKRRALQERDAADPLAYKTKLAKTAEKTWRPILTAVTAPAHGDQSWEYLDMELRLQLVDAFRKCADLLESSLGK